MAEKDTTTATPLGEMNKKISKAQELCGGIAAYAYLGGEKLQYEDDYDPALTPWNEGGLIEAAFNQIRRQVSEIWDILAELPDCFKEDKPKIITDVADALETVAKEAQEIPKLSAYEPGIANAKISIVSLWKHIEALDAIANDPAKVKEWAVKIHDEIQQCQVA
jgi:hypothetical protein